LTADNALTANTALTTAGVSSYYAESLVQSSTNSSSYQDKITLTLQPGTYLITFSAQVSSNQNNGLAYKFDAGSYVFDGIPVLSGTNTEFISVSNTIRVVYTIATTVKIQYNKNQSGGATGYIKGATIFALPTN
ncbi:MAG: hypothetical protein JWO06_382, partial [Bacteroidota bacterium]|nr:hypothetical protein [Bacteroidota bacterium]